MFQRVNDSPNIAPLQLFNDSCTPSMSIFWPFLWEALVFSSLSLPQYSQILISIAFFSTPFSVQLMAHFEKFSFIVSFQKFHENCPKF